MGPHRRPPTNALRLRPEISAAIRTAYPDRQSFRTGGPSLWNFFSEMCIGDLVILTTDRRAGIAEVTGEYEYFENYPLAPLSRDGTPYRHQRKVVQRTEWEPNELWSKAGCAAAGQSIHWTLLRCQNPV